MIELIKTNFLVLLPILILSFFGIAIIIERFFYFNSIKDDEEITRRAGGLYSQGKDSMALEALGTTSNSAERVLLRYALENRFMLDDMLRQRLQIIARNRIILMEKHVAFLTTIANIATLLGLLGTVFGLIVSFKSMGTTGIPDLSVLAQGLSQALVTTAAGLITAIPSLLAYHFFRETITKKVERMNNLIAEILTSKNARM